MKKSCPSGYETVLLNIPGGSGSGIQGSTKLSLEGCKQACDARAGCEGFEFTGLPAPNGYKRCCATTPRPRHARSTRARLDSQRVGVRSLAESDELLPRPPALWPRVMLSVGLREATEIV